MKSEAFALRKWKELPATHQIKQRMTFWRFSHLVKSVIGETRCNRMIAIDDVNIVKRLIEDAEQ